MKKNELKMNDSVSVSEPSEGDLWNFEFIGTAIGFKENGKIVIVEDQGGDCFDVPYDKITICDDDEKKPSEVKERNYKVRREFPDEDLNMPNTKIESIRNKVAELSAHGLNANEINRELQQISKPELVRVIMDLLENPPEE